MIPDTIEYRRGGSVTKALLWITAFGVFMAINLLGILYQLSVVQGLSFLFLALSFGVLEKGWAFKKLRRRLSPEDHTRKSQTDHFEVRQPTRWTAIFVYTLVAMTALGFLLDFVQNHSCRNIENKWPIWQLIAATWALPVTIFAIVKLAEVRITVVSERITVRRFLGLSVSHHHLSSIRSARYVNQTPSIHIDLADGESMTLGKSYSGARQLELFLIENKLLDSPELNS